MLDPHHQLVFYADVLLHCPAGQRRHRCELQLSVLWEDLRRSIKTSPWQFKFHLSLLLLVYQKRNFHPTQTSENAVENFHIFHWSHETQPWNINVDRPDLTVYLLYQGEKFHFTVLYYKKSILFHCSVAAFCERQSFSILFVLVLG